MDSTGCHLTCIISAAATERQIVIYFDDVAHQHPVCREALFRKKLPLTIRAVMLEEYVDLVAGISTAPLVGAHAATTENSPE